VYDLVSRAHDLRVNAQIQMQAIALGGRINYLPPPPPRPANAPPPTALKPDGSGGGRLGGERAWEYWRQIIEVK
jgi:hypothetical protein